MGQELPIRNNFQSQQPINTSQPRTYINNFNNNPMYIQEVSFVRRPDDPNNLLPKSIRIR